MLFRKLSTNSLTISAAIAFSAVACGDPSGESSVHSSIDWHDVINQIVKTSSFSAPIKKEVIRRAHPNWEPMLVNNKTRAVMLSKTEKITDITEFDKNFEFLAGQFGFRATYPVTAASDLSQSVAVEKQGIVVQQPLNWTSILKIQNAKDQAQSEIQSMTVPDLAIVSRRLVYLQAYFGTRETRLIDTPWSHVLIGIHNDELNPLSIFVYSRDGTKCCAIYATKLNSSEFEGDDIPELLEMLYSIKVHDSETIEE